MIGSFASLAKGFFTPFRGMKMMAKTPSLWPWVAIPIILNTLLYAGFAWIYKNNLERWLDNFINTSDGFWSKLFYYVLASLLAVVLVVVVGYTFTMVGSLLFSPFNDVISEKVEKLYSGVDLTEPFSLSRTLSGAAIAFVAALKRIILYLLVFGIVVVIGLLPPFGTTFAAIVGPPVTFFFFAWEFFDYPMDRHRFRFADKRRGAFSNLWAFLGFGAGTTLLLMIPLAGLFLLPACVTGATMLFRDLIVAGKLTLPEGHSE
ncbi:MAG: hypothetical protein C0609_12790, partial [Deltaproteobacteria bacterium]